MKRLGPPGRKPSCPVSTSSCDLLGATNRGRRVLNLRSRLLGLRPAPGGTETGFPRALRGRYRSSHCDREQSDSRAPKPADKIPQAPGIRGRSSSRSPLGPRLFAERTRRRRADPGASRDLAVLRERPPGGGKRGEPMGSRLSPEASREMFPPLRLGVACRGRRHRILRCRTRAARGGSVGRPQLKTRGPVSWRAI